MAVRTIGTEIKLSGEKEFKDAMKAMSSNLKTLRSDMAVTSAAFDGNADSLEALTAKQKILQESVEQHRAKVDALQAKYEQVSATYGENSALADKYKQQLNNATVAMLKETRALEQNEKAMEAAGKETKEYIPLTQRLARASDNAGDAVRDLAADAMAAARKIPGLSEAIDVAQVGAKGLAGAAGAVGKGIGAIAKASTVAIAGLVTLGTVALTHMVNFAKEAADSARQAYEAGETLTESQQKWLEYSDSLQTLDAAANSAKSALGDILLPVLSDLSKEGSQFLSDFARDMEAASGDAEAQGQVLADYIVRGAELIRENLPEYLESGRSLFSGLGDGLSEAGPELLDMAGELILELLNGFMENAPEMAAGATELIQKLTEFLTDHGPELIESAVSMVSQIVSGLGQAAPDLIPAVTQLIIVLITALIESAPQLLLAGAELVLGIVSGLLNASGYIRDAAVELIDGMIAKFGDSMSLFGPVGRNVVEGIWDGIKNATGWMFDNITAWVGDVVDWIKEKLGIASPSKVMEAEVGAWMARGIGSGFQKEMRNVNRTIAQSINTTFDLPVVTPSGRTYNTRGYNTPGGKTVNLYFTAKTITESEINMVVDIVNRKLGDEL